MNKKIFKKIIAVVLVPLVFFMQPVSWVHADMMGMPGSQTNNSPIPEKKVDSNPAPASTQGTNSPTVNPPTSLMGMMGGPLSASSVATAPAPAAPVAATPSAVPTPTAPTSAAPAAAESEAVVASEAEAASEATEEVSTESASAVPAVEVTPTTAETEEAAAPAAAVAPASAAPASATAPATVGPPAPATVGPPAPPTTIEVKPPTRAEMNLWSRFYEYEVTTATPPNLPTPPTGPDWVAFDPPYNGQWHDALGTVYNWTVWKRSKGIDPTPIAADMQSNTTNSVQIRWGNPPTPPDNLGEWQMKRMGQWRDLFGVMQNWAIYERCLGQNPTPIVSGLTPPANYTITYGPAGFAQDATAPTAGGPWMSIQSGLWHNAIGTFRWTIWKIMIV